LLIATILSAQCTDERVNQVTKKLFVKYPSLRDFAEAKLSALEKDIRPTGFFRHKAQNIKNCCRMLLDEFQGKIPRDLDALILLPGVGRKTGNVVLGNAFTLASGVVVDTHVTRLSRRLGLTEEKSAERIEQDLISLVPKKHWIQFSHWFIHHGRQICRARKPACEKCFLFDLCPRLL
ncbi:MAG: endonuclease III, partial [Bdellovibrionales bacterium]|nr:endonuclease III [Bdellovibrionales bacterium]